MVRSVLIRLAVAACLASLGGCAYYHVRAPEPTPATDYRSATMHAFLWGAIEQEQIAENCVSNALDEVRVRNNYGYALITVLSLGIWMPMDVEWKCSKRPLEEGTL